MASIMRSSSTSCRPAFVGSASEIAELRAGTGVRLARAAELSDYPGPRHVLDAIESGRPQATPEQTERIRGIFDAMKRDAQRVGAQILEAEQQLEIAFRSGAMQDADLRTRVARIAALQSDLRVIHLGAHLATRAILSNAQVARNEIRGYASALPAEHRGDLHRDWAWAGWNTTSWESCSGRCGWQPR